jgi:hypothetical protein
VPCALLYAVFGAGAVPPPFKDTIHIPCSIMHAVISSATKAKLCALFYNGKDGPWLCTTLKEMGHPQPATPIQSDNACTASIINDVGQT